MKFDPTTQRWEPLMNSYAQEILNVPDENDADADVRVASFVFLLSSSAASSPPPPPPSSSCITPSLTHQSIPTGTLM
jgi:hypothetical protein